MSSLIAEMLEHGLHCNAESRQIAVGYPCFNGCVILVSSVLSIIILKEKLTRRQLLGLVLGILAVITVGVV